MPLDAIKHAKRKKRNPRRIVATQLRKKEHQTIQYISAESGARSGIVARALIRTALQVVDLSPEGILELARLGRF